MARLQRPAWMDWIFDSGIERVLQDLNTWAYRRTKGRIGGRFAAYGGIPVCLLTTTGRKSGKRRTVPLLYLRDGEVVVLVASRGGTDKTPLWYRNLVANPDVELQIGPTVAAMRARAATSEEKQTYWPRLVELYAPYENYQRWTDREIPLALLTPR